MCVFCFFFFFQAEDGIRDVERSRGLGDVYKRQTQSTWEIVKVVSLISPHYFQNATFPEVRIIGNNYDSSYYHSDFQYVEDLRSLPVSYTHLTLPTILLVQISVVAVSLKKKKKDDTQNRMQ
eukprot:TRINITY_DN12685_c0_g1_i5.p4 TRINITY_DN12685_c0_g1~~TRINITY_DN12685_c0_g1_i5.p4  ORF type:complete len:122 (-),score=41.77 TRINITY_DN12685_c0_g1_i5:44-409(-)